MQVRLITYLRMMTELKKLKILFLFLLFMATNIKVNAQYVLLKADEEYKLFNYSTAIKLYTEAYQKKASLHAIERLADCYRFTKDYLQAESWYALLTKTKGAKPEAFFYYGEALRNNSKYSEAKTQYEKYAELKKSLGINQKNLLLLSCDSALIWMKNPKPIVLNNEKGVNSIAEDWGSVIYQNSIVFTSDRTNVKVEDEVKKGKPFLKFDDPNKAPSKKIYAWTGNNYLRLYLKKNVDTAILFPFNAGSEYHIGAASFTKDEKEMFFTLTRIPNLIEREKGIPKTVKVEIYSSKKKDDGTWGLPSPFKYNNVNLYSVGDPYISRDGQSLYFVSDMPGGKGKTDIYVCHKNQVGEWGQATSMEDINTEGAERSPFFDDDNNFYFSTDGKVGMGGLDVFKAPKNGKDLGAAINMGYPLNSPQDDFAFVFRNKKEGFISSDRLGGRGSDDIYSFVVNPNLNFRLEGIAFNTKTGLPLSDVIVNLSKEDGTTLSVQTDQNGNYKFDLEENTLYNLNGVKTGYRNAQLSQVSSVGLKQSTVLKKNLYLDIIDLFKEVRLENIYYDLDKSNIRPDAAIELDKVARILKENPTIWIELGSHTDSRASDGYNLKLSQARADAAVSYIINKGIDRYRIRAKGYGETRLLNDCSNGKDCTEEQHQLNRRTEITVIKQ